MKDFFKIIALTFIGLIITINGKAQLDSIDYEIFDGYLSYLSNDSIKNKPLIINKCFVVYHRTKGITPIIKSENKENAGKSKKNTLKYYYENLMDETLSSFINKTDTFFIDKERFFSKDFKILVADDNVFKSIQKEENPTNLSAEFVGCSNILTFSNIGYGNSKKQALFYTQLLRGGFSSSGWFVVMEKKCDIWTVVKTILIWSS